MTASITKRILLLKIINMKLLTKELEKRFEQVWVQEHLEDPIVIAKFFHPMAGMTWFATEYDPNDRVFFGYVDSEFWERWTFSLNELESVVVNWLKMERDAWFEEKPFSKIKLRYDA